MTWIIFRQCSCLENNPCVLFLTNPSPTLEKAEQLPNLELVTHLKLRGQNIDPFMGSISFNPYRGQINHDLGHFL